MLIKGAMNAEAFLAYVEQCLAATVRRGDIVVADNISVHKVARRQESIEARGADLRFLPQYSPGPRSNCISNPSPEDTAGKGG